MAIPIDEKCADSLEEEDRLKFKTKEGRDSNSIATDVFGRNDPRASLLREGKNDYSFWSRSGEAQPNVTEDF